MTEKLKCQLKRLGFGRGGGGLHEKEPGTVLACTFRRFSNKEAVSSSFPTTGACNRDKTKFEHRISRMNVLFYFVSEILSTFKTYAIL
jgi:hypothetical protein